MRVQGKCQEQILLQKCVFSLNVIKAYSIKSYLAAKEDDQHMFLQINYIKGLYKEIDLKIYSKYFCFRNLGIKVNA